MNYKWLNIGTQQVLILNVGARNGISAYRILEYSELRKMIDATFNLQGVCQVSQAYLTPSCLD